MILRYQSALLPIVIIMVQIFFVGYGNAQTISNETKKVEISNIQEIELNYGINYVSFANVQGSVMIIKGYMEDAGPASHNHFLIEVKDDNEAARWDIVSVGPKADEGIDDDPDEGDDVIKTVRFFNANLKDVPTTVLLIATRRVETSIRTPGIVTIEVYRLAEYSYPTFPGFGFLLIEKKQTSKKYFNANAALDDEFELKSPKNYP